MGELARNGLPRLTAQPLYVSGDSGRLPSVSWPHFTRKTLDRAIEIARRTGRQLKVAAKIYDEDRDYYRGSIKPLLRETKSFVDFIGEIGGKDKGELMGNAHALLFPIDWPEPFGLVMIESLACGTPVIAWNNGSVPEVLSNGVTGFVVDTVDQAVEAGDEVARLKRVDCRRAFETRFDTARMAHDYLEVYSRLILELEGARPGEAYGTLIQPDRSCKPIHARCCPAESLQQSDRQLGSV